MSSNLVPRALIMIPIHKKWGNKRINPWTQEPWRGLMYPLYSNINKMGSKSYEGKNRSVL